jgi:ribonucleotide reductase beta subunit family protein with ferritin-like domain
MGDGIKNLMNQIEFMHESHYEYILETINEMEKTEETLDTQIRSLIEIKERMKEARTTLLLELPEN